MSKDADAIISLYQRHAQAFANQRGQHLFERAWLDRFLALLPKAARVLDIGCGAGQPIAAYLSGKGARVTGVDTSEPLLNLARDSLPEVEWITGDMRQLNLQRQFDGLLAWNSFFHLTPEDQRAMFPVFRTHANPGAALMFTAGPSHGAAIGCFQGEPLYHASLSPNEYRALLADHGFDVIAHIAEDPACQGHTVWLAQRRAD